MFYCTVHVRVECRVYYESECIVGRFGYDKYFTNLWNFLTGTTHYTTEYRLYRAAIYRIRSSIIGTRIKIPIKHLESTRLYILCR